VAVSFDGLQSTVAWISALNLFTATVTARANAPGVIRKASDVSADGIALASSSHATWLVYHSDGTPGVLNRAAVTNAVVAPATRVAQRGWLPSIVLINDQPLVAWTSLGTASTRVLARAGDADAVAIAPNAPERSSAGAASMPPNVVAAWQEEYGGISRIAVGGLDAAGQRLAVSGNILSASSVGALTPAVGEGRDALLVAWYDADQQVIAARRITAALQPLDAAPIVIAQSSGGAPAIAFDGTNWLVAFLRTEDPAFPASVAAVRVSQSGAVLDDTPIPISPFSFLGAEDVRTAWDGSAFRVVWSEFQGTRSSMATSISTARVLPDRSLLEQTQFAPTRVSIGAGSSGSLPTSLPYAVHGSSTTLVTWLEGSAVVGLLLPKPAEGQVVAAPARRRALRLGRFVIASQVSTVSAVAFDGARFHVFWSRLANPATSFETIVSQSAEVTQVIPTLPPVLDGAQLGNALALVTSDSQHAPGLFWVVH
jgi:hypothetical protein